MRDSIYTIPISEVFEPKSECPICHLFHTLEDRCVEYITGAAMMEPDVRIETNRSGFCFDHYSMMLEKRNRLSVALILESHLDHIFSDVLTKSGLSSFAKSKSPAEKSLKSCYVCDTVNSVMDSMLSNTFKLWEKERDFRKLYSEQKYICMPHAVELINRAQSQIGKKNIREFCDTTLSLSRNYLESLRSDITSFCRSFDYRNANEPLNSPEIKNSVERSVSFLTSKYPSK